MTLSLAFMLTFYPKIVPNTHINRNKLFFPFPLPIRTKFSSKKRKNTYFLILLAIYHFTLTFCDFRTKLTKFSSDFENSYLIVQMSNWYGSKGYVTLIKYSFRDKYNIYPIGSSKFLAYQFLNTVTEACQFHWAKFKNS